MGIFSKKIPDESVFKSVLMPKSKTGLTLEINFTNLRMFQVHCYIFLAMGENKPMGIFSCRDFIRYFFYIYIHYHIKCYLICIVCRHIS